MGSTSKENLFVQQTDICKAEETKHRQKKTSDDEQAANAKKIGVGITMAQSVDETTRKAAQTYAKPMKYDRSRYDDAGAKARAKDRAFAKGKTVRDSYTKKKLVKTQEEAKRLYGDDWPNYVAESDHTIPIKDNFDQMKNNPWLKDQDIKEIVNTDGNFKVISKKVNTAKGAKSNKDLAANSRELKKSGVNITEKGKENLLADEKAANKAIKRETTTRVVKNVVKTTHEAGLNTAKNAAEMAGVMSGINNIYAVLKGDKEISEALVDTATDTGKAALVGYLTGGGLAAITQSLSKSSSKFITALTESNVPGKIVAGVMQFGDTIVRYTKGEITTSECLIDIGDKGLSMATATYGMAVGRALIPIPVVGAAVGAFVATTLTSEYYHKLIDTLENGQLEHEERLRLIAEAEEAARQTRAYREELEEYLEKYFGDYKNCFGEALMLVDEAFQSGNADGVIRGANKITKKLGGKTSFESVEEYRALLMDETYIENF